MIPLSEADPINQNGMRRPRRWRLVAVATARAIVRRRPRLR
jgi:hypothetical protein